MFFRRNNAFRSWMFLYAGFVAAIALTNQNGDVEYSDSANLSPVTIGADAPALPIDELVRRSDI